MANSNGFGIVKSLNIGKSDAAKGLYKIKVQRLFRKEVHSSEWKREAPINIGWRYSLNYKEIYRELFISMIHPNPDKRTTAENILKSKWLGG